jgi:hypothetical protein
MASGERRRPELSWLRNTKGKEKRDMLFSASACEAIQAHLKVRRDGAQPWPWASLPVFAGHNQRAGYSVPLSTRSVHNIFFELA